MMEVIKTLLLATTAANQAFAVPLLCAGTAAHVLHGRPAGCVVFMTLIVLMVLMNLTHILIVTFAKMRAVCSAKVFLIIVERSVMDMHHVQINGTNYSLYANLTLAHTNQMTLMIKSAMRRLASTHVEMDLFVWRGGMFATVERIVQMAVMKTLSTAKASVVF